jgi:hypothetical protein
MKIVPLQAVISEMFTKRTSKLTNCNICNSLYLIFHLKTLKVDLTFHALPLCLFPLRNVLLIKKVTKVLLNNNGKDYYKIISCMD